MRFIKDGPDVPERLVQAQEDGKVVFFCGAGISYLAGLPLFDGLVKKIYDELGEFLDPVEQTAFDESRFDTVIYLLERRISNGAQPAQTRTIVREKLWKILSAIDTTKPKATQTHPELSGCLRLLLPFALKTPEINGHLTPIGHKCVRSLSDPRPSCETRVDDTSRAGLVYFIFPSSKYT